MIRIRNQQQKIKVSIPRIERTIRRILKALSFPYDPELSILLVNDRKIRELNSRFRGIDKPTNLLSFPVMEGWFRSQRDGPEILGDIVISIPAVLREAREREITLYEGLSDLLIHGILHLYGYRHESDYTATRMRRKEREIKRFIS